MGFLNCFTPIALAVTAAFLLLPAESSSSHGGFTVNLIHRDSPKSPLYNPSHSPYELMKRAHHRSSRRKEFFSSTTGIVPDDGEYLVEISFGTPPFKTFAIADSGSDLSWIQCKPCPHCFEETFPIFNPKNSSSFKSFPCSSETCKVFSGHCNGIETKVNPDGRNRTNPNHNSCVYDMSYGDGSSSHGILATETITFGSSDYGKRRPASSFPKFVFGCAHDIVGKFPNKSSGVVGLGFGNQSIITQLNSSISGKFSYCLGPFSEPSKSGMLSFGKEAAVSGHGVVSTPLILDFYYYLILEGMSVGNERLNYSYTSPPPSPDHNKPLKGNIIIDSGTTATYLPEELHEQLESKVRSKLNKPSIKSVEDPVKFFSLCYEGLDDSDVPNLTLHFKGADLELKPLNTFVATSDTVKCLCFASSGLSRIPIFGNIAQNNLLVGYDLINKTVSFKRTDCTKHD